MPQCVCKGGWVTLIREISKEQKNKYHMVSLNMDSKNADCTQARGRKVAVRSLGD